MNVIIVHGSNEDKEDAQELPLENERHWKPWLKKKLEEKGIGVSNELYPKDWNPDYSEWKKIFEKNEINEDTILIGHSAGGGFLVRWLGDAKRKVKKLILVAPAIKHGNEFTRLDNLLKFEISSIVKELVGEIIIFVSDDEDEGIKKSVRIFSEKLYVEPIELKGKGHFTLGDMGTNEFFELLEEVLK